MFAGTLALPLAAPQPVLALGAYLKNTVCRLHGQRLDTSTLHGDLGEVDTCMALDASARRLAALNPRPAAIAHDLHPDFPSTRLAQVLADELQVPAWAVQHHRAHIAVVQAESGLRGPVLGLALDGVGLGSDGTAWGGELLWADDPARSSRWARLAHLPALLLPGGDRAAREPWRVAAGLLWQQGRADQIGARLGLRVGAAAARGVAELLARRLNCPPTTAAGRWFDAAAAALGVHLGTQSEAEAAIALERAAAEWLADHPGDIQRLTDAAPLLLADLPALVAGLFDTAAERRGEGAARFHLALAAALAHATLQQAAALDVGTVVLGGGCFFNRVLSAALTGRLEAAGLRVLRPAAAGCGDAGLALGQAWLASWAQQRDDAADALSQPCSTAATATSVTTATTAITAPPATLMTLVTPAPHITRPRADLET
jgi:hydrogenase maturation protein HypF